MWVTTLGIFTLALLFAVLGLVIAASAKLERSLASLVADHSERLTKMERELDRVRQVLDRYEDVAPTRPIPQKERLKAVG
jgi:hypothetical protein